MWPCVIVYEKVYGMNKLCITSYPRVGLDCSDCFSFDTNSVFNIWILNSVTGTKYHSANPRVVMHYYSITVIELNLAASS